MIDIVHINAKPPDETDHICICLCGYTFPGYGQGSMWAGWFIEYENRYENKYEQVTCEVCLERFPLLLLASTELE